ncbi:hypothetical protein PR048_030882 [Dryococelus australis]|uniref:Uncharacterized protein n=1 Tax=Dryococelus australis TaxID=614101 RepID=A0ABQ9GCZ0_9NEOP|nr:hypothetical protein PR048_030882 [Dryococelus australis]
MEGRDKRENHEKTSWPAAPSGTMPTYEHPGATRPGMQLGLPRGCPACHAIGDDSSRPVATAILSNTCVSTRKQMEMGWTYYSPPTKANLPFDSRRKSLSGFRRWSVGFLVDLPFPLPLHSGAAPYSPRFTLISSQDPEDKSRPNLFTPFTAHFRGQPLTSFAATVDLRLACSPPTKAIRVQSLAGSFRIFACGNRVGRCRLSAGFLGDLPFPPPSDTSTSLAGSQDLDAKGRSNLFTLTSVTLQAAREWNTEQPSNKEERQVDERVRGKTGEEGVTASSVATSPSTHTRCPDQGTPQASHNTTGDIHGGGNGRSPRKTRRPAALSGTIPTCENPGMTRPRIEPFSPWWVASRLIAKPPPPLFHHLPDYISFKFIRPSRRRNKGSCFQDGRLALCCVSAGGRVMWKGGWPRRAGERHGYSCWQHPRWTSTYLDSTYRLRTPTGRIYWVYAGRTDSKWGRSASVDRQLPNGAAVAQWIESSQVGPQWPKKITVGAHFDLLLSLSSPAALPISSSQQTRVVPWSDIEPCSIRRGATVVQWLDYSPPTWVNRGRSRIFASGGSCRTMQLVGGFSRRYPVSPALAFRRCSILTSLHPHRHPNLSTPFVEALDFPPFSSFHPSPFPSRGRRDVFNCSRSSYKRPSALFLREGTLRPCLNSRVRLENNMAAREGARVSTECTSSFTLPLPLSPRSWDSREDSLRRQERADTMEDFLHNSMKACMAACTDGFMEDLADAGPFQGPFRNWPCAMFDGSFPTRTTWIAEDVVDGTYHKYKYDAIKSREFDDSGAARDDCSDLRECGRRACVQWRVGQICGTVDWMRENTLATIVLVSVYLKLRRHWVESSACLARVFCTEVGRSRCLQEMALSADTKLDSTVLYTLEQKSLVYWLPPQAELTLLLDPATRSEATRVLSVHYWLLSPTVKTVCESFTNRQDHWSLYFTVCSTDQEIPVLHSVKYRPRNTCTSQCAGTQTKKYLYFTVCSTDQEIPVLRSVQYRPRNTCTSQCGSTIPKEIPVLRSVQYRPRNTFTSSMYTIAYTGSEWVKSALNTSLRASFSSVTRSESRERALTYNVLQHQQQYQQHQPPIPTTPTTNTNNTNHQYQQTNHQHNTQTTQTNHNTNHQNQYKQHQPPIPTTLTTNTNTNNTNH